MKSLQLVVVGKPLLHCVRGSNTPHTGRRSGESAVTDSWRRIVGCADRADFQLHSSSIHGSFIA